MSTLTFTVVDARPAPHTASPAITFQIRIVDHSGARVHAMALRSHVRIEPRNRRYSRDEQQRLYELFGNVSQWDRTLQSVTWAQTALAVPSFEGQTQVDVAVPCTYDLEVASAKYLHAVREGDVPLLFLFSGTVFRTAGDRVCIEPIAWDSDTSFRLPAHVWQLAMDQFFPGGGWIRLQRETIDRLQAFRGRQAVVSWDEAIDRLLEHEAAKESV